MIKRQKLPAPQSRHVRLPPSEQSTISRLLPWAPFTPLGLGELDAALQRSFRHRCTEEALPFNIFDALLRHPDLTLYFTRFVELQTLINLYSVSKPFYLIASARFMAIVQGHMAINAPLAPICWPWKLYKNLCMRDPGRRLLNAKHCYATNEVVGLADIEESSMVRKPHASIRNQPRQGRKIPRGSVSPQKRQTVSIKDLRGIPTFRYLKMVTFRQKVVEDIIALFAEEGIPLPDRIEETLGKIWLMLDIPYSMRRVSLIHNTDYWTDNDLIRAMTFFLRLDLRLTHPIYGSGSTALRSMLLAQRSLSYLWKVLKREELRTPLEALRMIVAFKYRPVRHYGPLVKSILGMPLKQTGLLQYDFWGRRGRTRLMIGIDALVLREGIRRKMDLASNSTEFMIGGFIDKRTGEDVWPQGTPGIDEDFGAADGSHSDASGSENVGGRSLVDAQNDDGMHTMWEISSVATVSVDQQCSEATDTPTSSDEDHGQRWWDSTSDDQTDVENN